VFRGQFVRLWCVVRIVAAVCDMGVANRSWSDSSSVGRLRVQPSAGKGRCVCGGGGGKEVQRVVISMRVELRIVTTHNERGVRGGSNNSRSSIIIIIGGLRVHAGVYDRHLLHDECEGSGGGTDTALRRAEVRGSSRRIGWIVDIASFRRHFDKGRKGKS
jgi:hypothetical protein